MNSISMAIQLVIPPMNPNSPIALTTLTLMHAAGEEGGGGGRGGGGGGERDRYTDTLYSLISSFFHFL